MIQKLQHKKDKEDFKIYTKPAPEDVKPEDLKKAREFYDKLVKGEIELAYLHKEGTISVEEAENRIRSDCHNEIEKMMKNDLEWACSMNENGLFNGAIDMLEVYLDKLQELKGSDKE